MHRSRMTRAGQAAGRAACRWTMPPTMLVMLMTAMLPGPAAPAAAPPIDRAARLYLDVGADLTPPPINDVVRRSRAVRIDVAAVRRLVPGSPIAWDLFVHEPLAGRVTMRRDLGPDRFVLRGVIDGDPGGVFTIALNRGATWASIRLMDATTYRLRDLGNALAILEETDEALEMPCGMGEFDAGLDPAPDAIIDPGPPGGGAPTAGPACTDNLVIDVLMLYSPSAANAAGGQGPIEALVDLMIDVANEALTNSGLPFQYNLAHVTMVDYDEGPGNHLGRLQGRSDGSIDGIHDLRDAVGADIVTLLVNTAPYCGVAFLMTDPVAGNETQAFNVVVWHCADHVFAHEAGHNLGCCHARGDGGGCADEGIFWYSVGHRFFGDSGQQWRTVMAYSPGQRIRHFSHPFVFYDGQPTGVPTTDPLGAHNALTINQTGPIAARYRCDVVTCADLGLPDDPNDCNNNYVPDNCDLGLGFSEDVNLNDVPDDCERPVNDTCFTPLPIFNDQTIIFLTEVADIELGDDPGCGTMLRDVWFVFDVPDDGELEVTACLNGLATQVAVYDACPQLGGQVIGCTTDGCAGPLLLPDVAPAPHFIRIAAAGGAFGVGSVHLAFTPAPPCDTTSTADCNANGIPDVCDVSTSFDQADTLAPFGTNYSGLITYPSPPEATSDVTLLLEAHADLEAIDEFVTVTMGGFPIGTFFQIAGGCAGPPDTATITLPASTYNIIRDLADDLVVEVIPSAAVATADCNGSSMTVTMQYTFVSPFDLDGNGIVDSCQVCPADVAGGDWIVDANDLVALIGAWGTGDAAYDIGDANGVVDTADLLYLLLHWGPCF